MSPLPFVPSLGTYFTPADGFRHAIISTPDGELHEIYFNPKVGGGARNATLGSFCGLHFLTAFYTPDDGLQHPLVATATGDVFEVSYKPGSFNVTGSLVNFPNLIALSGFFAGNDNMRIFIAGTSDGLIHEVFFDAQTHVHITQPALANFPGLTHLAAFYTDDDQYRHVIVATADGNITEIWYSAATGIHITNPPLANFQGIVSIGAFYAANDQMRIVIVATSDGLIHEIFYKSAIGVHITQPALANFPGVLAISAFYTPDDGNRHVIVLDDRGAVTEVFYNSADGVSVTHPALATFAPPRPVATYVGPDVTNLDPVAIATAALSSPSGRCIALTGTSVRLHVFSDTGGIWSSTLGGVWVLEPGSPAPSKKFGATISVLAISPVNSDRVLAATDSGLWETTNGGTTWFKLLDPMTLGSNSSMVTSVQCDDAGRVFAAVNGGVATQQTANGPFALNLLGDDFTAIAVTGDRIWARSATALWESGGDGMGWGYATAIPTNIPFMNKEQASLAAAGNFVFLLASTPGSYPQNPNGCAANNVLVIYNAATGVWSTQDVTSTDKKTWQEANGVPVVDAHTCQGTGGENSVDGRQFVKCIRLNDPTLANVIGQGVQLLYGAGQEVWRAIGQNADGTITDWNWAVGTTGRGFSNLDPVHADIWDFHLDPSAGGRTAWVACDGGVYSTTVSAANYEFSNAVWKPAMQGLHTHQIQSLTALSTNQVSKPRFAYVIGDNSCFFQDTSAVAEPAALWQSYDALGDGNFSAGDSSAPAFAWIARQLDTEAFLRFGTGPQSAWLINPKTGTFIDPSIPTRFRFVPSPWLEGQFATADAVMMVDLPLVFDQTGVSLPNQPGPSSNGKPVLIRNRTFNVNPDINAANAQGKSWTLERGTLPTNCVGFAVSGNRTLPIYYAFDGGTLFAERNGKWTSVVENLVSTQTFGPVFPNPYDSAVVYVLTSDKGVQISVDQGTTFQPEATLNALLGVDASDVNQIAFNYESPAFVVVGTESGKLLFSSGGGKWNDLSGVLPSPPIPIRSVAVDCSAIYIGTFGRGLWRIAHFGSQ